MWLTCFVLWWRLCYFWCVRCMHMVCRYAHKYIYTWRPEDDDEHLPLSLFAHPLRADLSLKWKLTILAQLATIRWPELLVSASQCWSFGYVLATLGFLHGHWRFELKSLCFHSKSSYLPGHLSSKVCDFFFWNKISLCSSGRLRARSSLPAVVSQVLGQ